MGKLVTTVNNFFENAQDYDSLVSMTTLGMDDLWKDTMLNLIDFTPKNILDLASGTGVLSFRLAERFPNSQVIGMDITKSFTEKALAKQEMNQIKNVKFVLGDAEEPSKHLPNNYKADLIIASYLPKYVNHIKFIKDIRKISHSNTLIILQDFAYPDILFEPAYVTVFGILELYFRLEPELQGYSNFEVFNLIKSTTWIEDFKTEFIKKNYIVEEYSQPLGISHILVIKKKK